MPRFAMPKRWPIRSAPVSRQSWPRGDRETPLVAVKSHEAGCFLARSGRDIFLYPGFGTDTGLVSERVRTIIAQTVGDQKDPFQLVRIGGDELAADPLRLADEA